MSLVAEARPHQQGSLFVWSLNQIVSVSQMIKIFFLICLQVIILTESGGAYL